MDHVDSLESFSFSPRDRYIERQLDHEVTRCGEKFFVSLVLKTSEGVFYRAHLYLYQAMNLKKDHPAFRNGDRDGFMKEFIEKTKKSERFFNRLQAGKTRMSSGVRRLSNTLFWDRRFAWLPQCDGSTPVGFDLEVIKRIP